MCYQSLEKSENYVLSPTYVKVCPSFLRNSICPQKRGHQRRLMVERMTKEGIRGVRIGINAIIYVSIQYYPTIQNPGHDKWSLKVLAPSNLSLKMSESSDLNWTSSDSPALLKYLPTNLNKFGRQVSFKACWPIAGINNKPSDRSKR